jgi:hypothetical protein
VEAVPHENNNCGVWILACRYRVRLPLFYKESAF